MYYEYLFSVGSLNQLSKNFLNLIYIYMNNNIESNNIEFNRRVQTVRKIWDVQIS